VAAVATMPGLRPLGLGEILDVGIKLCVRHWRTLALCVVWLVIPVQILSVLVLLSVAPDALDPTAESASTNDETSFFVAQAIVYLLQGLVYAISTAACFKAVSDAYLGSTPSARRSLRFGARRLPKLLALAFVVIGLFAVIAIAVTGLGAAFGPGVLVLLFLLLMVPFVWFAISWSLATPVLLFEAAGPIRSLRRSFALVKGRWLKVAATLFVGMFLVGFLSSILEGILVLLPALAAGGNEVVLAFATVVAGTIGSVVTTPFSAAVIALLYFDQRVRKEGFDLELLAAGIGERAPAGPSEYLQPKVSDEQRAQAPFWPPPPGWKPPAAEPEPPAPAPPGAWQPPTPPRWPPDSPERGSGGL